MSLAHFNQARDRSYGHAGSRDDWHASHHGPIALHVAVAQTGVGLRVPDRLRDILGGKAEARSGVVGEDGADTHAWGVLESVARLGKPTLVL